jgi:hypothetical protein
LETAVVASVNKELITELFAFSVRLFEIGRSLESVGSAAELLLTNERLFDVLTGGVRSTVIDRVVVVMLFAASLMEIYSVLAPSLEKV